MNIHPRYATSQEKPSSNSLPYINVPEWLDEIAPGDWILMEHISETPFYVAAVNKCWIKMGHPERPVGETIEVHHEAIAIFNGKYCGRTDERKWRGFVPFFGKNIHPYPVPA